MALVHSSLLSPTVEQHIIIIEYKAHISLHNQAETSPFWFVVVYLQYSDKSSSRTYTLWKHKVIRFCTIKKRLLLR
jgi:hypothetical protein